MRRRAISALAAALALVLTLVTPALAAGRPNWDGPLGAMAGPVVCETGRDYVLYYTIIGGVYRSADGVTWTELDRQWASAGWAYGTGVNGLAHKEFQFLWTGSEYMMRQSLLDDPREDTHQQYGDSPRNNWVTLLDEGFRIIGAKAFDGPVTDYGVAKPLALWALSGQSGKIQENVALLVGMVLYTGLNYFGQRFFAFRKKNS